MNEERAGHIANEIMTMYETYGGSEYSGEKVSQLEHMVQAAQLAEEGGHDEEVVLAAFLHDIGHIAEEANGENEMDSFGLKDHESIGAKYLEEKGFSKKITKLVASHVAAKRYLTRKDPDYYDQLSEASKKTLEFQGGMMSEAETETFERDPLFDEIILMRRWDEQAKIQDKPLPDLGRYRTMILKHLIS
jgi:2-amino-1-hydroxyethylphosphonate dioxygenase (glycine-forming)